MRFFLCFFFGFFFIMFQLFFRTIECRCGLVISVFGIANWIFVFRSGF